MISSDLHGDISGKFQDFGNLMFRRMASKRIGKACCSSRPKYAGYLGRILNELTVNMGAANSRDSLIDIANRVTVTYTELIEYPDGTEPVTGVTSETLIARTRIVKENTGFGKV
jgi:hypothetical protein